ncbi:MAG: diguanylate cyclase [Eubacteriales bacterium]|nr:diguanylate cyclase [Eubacteriales bacterium]MDD4630593.1 diguanylate cyclase [Eubacteriales bacterium]
MLIYQFLLGVSIFLMVVLIILIILKNKKKQIHYAVLGIAISLLIWNTSVLCQISFTDTPWILAACEKIYFTGTIFVSVAILFTGLIFAQIIVGFSWKYSLLLIVPVISLAVLFTNSYHHFYYTTFSLIPSEQDFGFYFIIHTAYSYLCIGIGLFCFLYYSVKNYGFFSKQAILISLALVIGLIADSFSTFHIFDWSAAVENIIFSVTVILFILAIVKYNFLNVVPIALRKVVDIITDVYVVFSEEYEIIDFNNAFEMTWSGVSRETKISEVMKQNCPDFDVVQFGSLVSQSIREQATISLAVQRQSDGGINYYVGEITPIIVKDRHVGTIMLIKDITEQKKNLEEVIRLNEKLQSLATKDWLTQAYNRYYFDERLEQEIERVEKLRFSGAEEAINSEYNFGLIMFDIDYFKIYNDLNGHQSGDELLQTIVNIVKEVLFSNNILCRYGGEEFVVICCHTPAEEVGIIAEKIRKTVEEYEFNYQDTQPTGNLTVSVGASYFVSPCFKKHDLIQKADQNLYLAKNTGKNKVVLWGL